MTTIVKHRRTGNEYILLGIAGEGRANPSRFISELFDRDKPEVSSSATVCDFQGNIFLAGIDDLIVTEIDGKKPTDLLAEPTFNTTSEAYETTGESVYAEPDFDDEEFDDEELNDEDEDTMSSSSESLIYGQGSTAQSQVEDEEDWI